MGDHVVFGGGSADSGGNASDLLVYSVTDDTWKTVTGSPGMEELRFHELAARDDGVVGVGTRDTKGVPFGSGPAGSSPWARVVADHEGYSGRVGLASNDGGEVRPTVHGPDDTRLFTVNDVDMYGEEATGSGSPAIDHFRPSIDLLRSPLDAGTSHLLDDGTMVSASDNGISVWSGDGATRTHAVHMDGFCGPVVHTGDGELLAWGGLGCGDTGTRIRLDTGS